jgi:uncharacterized coiled-coil DUF342 family protein
MTKIAEERSSEAQQLQQKLDKEAQLREDLNNKNQQLTSNVASFKVTKRELEEKVVKMGNEVACTLSCGGYYPIAKQLSRIILASHSL